MRKNITTGNETQRENNNSQFEITDKQMHQLKAKMHWTSIINHSNTA